MPAKRQAAPKRIGKSGLKRPAREHDQNQAGSAEFEREGMGVAPKE
jgi:hypothetical protein